MQEICLNKVMNVNGNPTKAQRRKRAFEDFYTGQFISDLYTDWQVRRTLKMVDSEPDADWVEAIKADVKEIMEDNTQPSPEMLAFLEELE